MYINLFSPITINKTKIKNRIIYPALGLMYSYDGKLNDRYYNYFREKAAGGAGIVTVGPVGVDFLGSGPFILSFADDKGIPDFTKMASIIKEEGAASWVQLFHAGAYSHPIMINGKQPIAPSPVYSHYSKTTPKEMTLEDIQQTQFAFAKAAARVQEAGFDGVEIIASAGYLITQFLSPIKNQRPDKYGGSLENRMRFPKELIEMIRQMVGPDFPISVRMAGSDFVKDSNTDAETPEFAKMYEKAGADLLNVTGGWHETRVPQMTSQLPQSAFSFLAHNIKRAVSLPVVASNRISKPETAEKLLKEGHADMVCIGRALIADPHWPNKAQVGKADEIRPCVACLKGCMDEVMTGRPAFCVANPFAGFENVRKVPRADSPKKVMVVGAGLAGLEAAVTATQAGHKVDLYEKDSNIGGQIWAAGAPPHKEELLEFARYYQAMLNKLKIPLHLNTKVDLDFIKKQKPDHLIVAEGAVSLFPPIKGLDDPSVISAWKVLKENPQLGRKVAVIGGGAVGLESALFVASRGVINPEIAHFLLTYDAVTPERLLELMFIGTSKATVFEMLPKAGQDVGKSTKWVLMSNLKRFGVTINTNSRVVEIKEGSIVYEKDGERKEESFDNIIVASGSKAVKEISEQIETLGIPFDTVGDCVQPGKINDAIHSAFLAAVEI